MVNQALKTEDAFQQPCYVVVFVEGVDDEELEALRMCSDGVLVHRHVGPDGGQFKRVQLVAGEELKEVEHEEAQVDRLVVELHSRDRKQLVLEEGDQEENEAVGGNATLVR